MSEQKQINEAIKRIMAIEWKYFDESLLPSHQLLAKEYLRRLVIWAKALNILDRWSEITFRTSYLFDELPISSEIDERVRDYIFKQTNFHTAHVCMGYIYWEAMKERQQIKKFDLPHPYEPLIIFFERGGYYKPDHGGFLDKIYVPIKNWKDYDHQQPFVSLDREFLDNIDNNFENNVHI